MQPTSIFALAADHNRWLSARQSAVAQNVANANTPGYRAMDAAPFETAMADAAGMQLAATQPGHFGAPTGDARAVSLREAPVGDASHSGNTVDLEREMLASGQIASGFALNAGVMKAFQRMLLASAKG